MLRIVVGLIKGALVGGAAAYGLLRAGFTSGVYAYIACVVVGALVGVVAGKPPWKSETMWTPIIKLIVGGAVGAGLCAVGLKVMPEFTVQVSGLGDIGSHTGVLL